MERTSTAEDRSESYVMAEILSAARKRVDGEIPDDFEELVDEIAESQ